MANVLQSSEQDRQTNQNSVCDIDQTNSGQTKSHVVRHGFESLTGR